MATFSVSVIVATEYTIEIEADSADDARNAVEELDGDDVNDRGDVESYGAPRVIAVDEAGS